MKERKLMIHSSTDIKNQRMNLMTHITPAQKTKNMNNMEKDLLRSKSQVQNQKILLLILIQNMMMQTV